MDSDNSFAFIPFVVFKNKIIKSIGGVVESICRHDIPFEGKAFDT